MRNAIRLLLCICLLVPALAGCNSTDDQAGTDAHVPGVSDTAIRLGSSLALTGHAGYLGTQVLRGAQAYLHHINDSGGVHGRRIDVIALDDSYDPPHCLVNTQDLIIDNNVLALFCYVGTPTTVKVLPLVTEARIPLIGMFTGANRLREPFNRYVINIRASYYQETASAVRHIVKDLGHQQNRGILPVRRLRVRRPGWHRAGPQGVRPGARGPRLLHPRHPERGGRA